MQLHLPPSFFAGHHKPLVRFWPAFARTRFNMNPLGNPAAPNATSPECFAAETFVHTEHGTVEIDRLAVGTRVLSRSETTGEQTYCRVVKKFV